MVGIFLSAVILVVWLHPAIGWSQVAAEAGTTELSWWLQAIIAVIGFVGTFVLNTLRRYFGQLIDLAAEKTKLAFLSQVDDVVMYKVSELWQTEVKALKAAAVDGKLTQEEKDDLKGKAITWLRSFLDVKLLTKVFGLSVNSGLSTIIDHSVMRHKIAGKLANPSTP